MRSGNLVKHKVERTADGKQFSNTPRGFCRNTIINIPQDVNGLFPLSIASWGTFVLPKLHESPTYPQ